MSTDVSQVSRTFSTSSNAADDFLASVIEANQQITGLTRVRLEDQYQITLQVKPQHRPNPGSSSPTNQSWVAVLDVDSTLIQGEVIDVLAELAGRGKEVATITERAMLGEIDFGEALAQRVKLLAGLPESALVEISESLRLQQGAQTLISTLQAHGCIVGLVSGGFSQVVGPLAESVGVSYTRANTLEISGSKLTGRVVGAVVDRAGKAAALSALSKECGVPLERSFAIGDGANDLDMINLAKIGIAFNARPALRAQADATVDSPYLSDCLFVMGFLPARAT